MRISRAWIIGLLLVCAGASADEISRLKLPANDLVYDALRGRIYASVPGSGGSIGNSVATIDPFTGVVIGSVFIGNEPGKLALSDDGSTLYVAVESGAAVRRMDIASQTPGAQFALGGDPVLGNLGTYYVEDMEALPGNPNAVAISRRFFNGVSPRHAGVAIYENGVARPNVTPSHTGSNVIAFSPSASRLYGYNTEGDGEFFRMAVDASGVSVIDGGFLRGLGDSIRFDGGLIYGSSGTILDPERRVLVGTFPGLVNNGVLLAPDARAGRAFFLKGVWPPIETESTYTLLAYDERTFLPVGLLSIPGVAGKPGGLIRWGTDGLAFGTSAGQLFLIHTALIPSALPPRRRIAVFRPKTGEWLLRADDGSGTAVAWGAPGDEPVPGDYLGTGTAQIAVFRASTREWFVRSDAGGGVTVPWGGAGDLPVPADYRGLGRAQIAVFRPGTQEWFLRGDDGSATRVQFGAPGDVPVPADYFGLRRAPIAVFRPSTGEWLVRTDAGGTVAVAWGAPGDVPVPGDYDGAGHAQIAVFRPSTGEWFVRDDATHGRRIPFGAPGDLPVPGEYARLGRAQIAVYRPGTGSWRFYNEQASAAEVPWGGPGDRPVPAAFAPGFGKP